MKKIIYSWAGCILVASISVLSVVGVLLLLRGLSKSLWPQQTLSNFLWTQEAAGWAQALGSIAALAIAIFLAGRQHRSAQHLMKAADAAALNRRLGSVLAILDHAAHQLKNVTDQIKGEGIYSAYRTSTAAHDVKNLDRMICTIALNWFAGRPQFADLVEMINRVPMHELGSLKLVRALFSAKQALQHFDEHLRVAHEQGEDAYQDAPIWNGASTAEALLSSSRSAFAKELDRLTEMASPR